MWNLFNTCSMPVVEITWTDKLTYILGPRLILFLFLFVITTRQNSPQWNVIHKFKNPAQSHEFFIGRIFIGQSGTIMINSTLSLLDPKIMLYHESVLIFFTITIFYLHLALNINFHVMTFFVFTQYLPYFLPNYWLNIAIWIFLIVAPLKDLSELPVLQLGGINRRL